MSHDPWENPPDANYWYAVRTYDAPSEEQLSAKVGEPLQLVDDSDNEWWYCICLSTQLAGYIPAMFIESTDARKARINTIRNKQLVLAQREDWMPPKNWGQKKKSVAWSTTLSFSDGTIRSTDKPAAPVGIAATPQSKRRSLTSLLRRTSSGSDKMDEHIAAMNQAMNNAAAAAAKEAKEVMLRIHAGIWDLGVSYKAVMVTPETKTEEVLRVAYEKFNPNESYVPNTYYLALQVGDAPEKRIAADAFPLVEWNKLSESERSKAKFVLQQNKLDKASAAGTATMIRIYGDETTFKTLMVDRSHTVRDVITTAVGKFKLVDGAEAYSIKEIADGKETILSPEQNIMEIISARKNGYQLLLVRSQAAASVTSNIASGDDDTDETLVSLRVYSSGLDLDVAYRAVLVSEEDTAADVVVRTLERFNSTDSPSDYHMEIVLAGQAIVLEDKDKVLEEIRATEAKNTLVTPKIYVRQKPGIASPPPSRAAAKNANAAAAAAAAAGGASSAPLSSSPSASSPTSSTPSTATASEEATGDNIGGDSLFVSKVPLRVYYDNTTSSVPANMFDGLTEYKTVMVTATTTAAALRAAASKRFGFSSADTQLQLCIYSDTMGVRVMDDNDSPLQLRTMYTESGHANVKLLLRKGAASSVITKDSFPIRVYGDKVWPQEGYKTIVATEQMTALDAIKQSLAKFKQGTDCNPDDFELSLVNEEGKEVLLSANETLSKDVKSTIYVLRRSGSRRDSLPPTAAVVAQRALMLGERRGSDSSIEFSLSASDVRASGAVSTDDEESGGEEAEPVVEAFSAAAFRQQRSGGTAAKTNVLLAGTKSPGGSRPTSVVKENKEIEAAFSNVNKGLGDLLSMLE